MKEVLVVRDHRPLVRIQIQHLEIKAFKNTLFNDTICFREIIKCRCEWTNNDENYIAINHNIVI